MCVQPRRCAGAMCGSHRAVWRLETAEFAQRVRFIREMSKSLWRDGPTRER